MLVNDKMNAVSIETTKAGARVAAGLALLLIGSFFVYGVGLANANMLHDTAHDTRHAFTFPCH